MCAFIDDMVNRRQAIDMVGLIVQLTGFIVLASLFFPAVRRGLSELGLVAMGLLMLVVLGLIGFSLYRLTARQNKMMTENPFAPPDDVSVQAGNSDQTGNEAESETGNAGESENAPDLLEPALRRRYPWRRETADHL
jgi:hypothetical protein